MKKDDIIYIKIQALQEILPILIQSWTNDEGMLEKNVIEQIKHTVSMMIEEIQK